MAITITKRPRIFYYNTSGSPSVAAYSNGNAAWNPILYIFEVLPEDILSSLNIKVYENGSNTLLADINTRPFRTGDFKVDLSTYVKPYLFSKYDPDFSEDINSTDKGGLITFYITYQQIFDNGTASTIYSEQQRPIIGICSVLQFGNKLGSNMAQYTPFNFNLPEEKKMKFMTSFKRPVMWKGWPFSLSFFYSTNVIGVQIFKREIQKNVNQLVLETEDTNLESATIGNVNYLKIKEPDQYYARLLNVSLRAGDPIDTLYVDEGYVDDGYVQIN